MDIHKVHTVLHTLGFSRQSTARGATRLRKTRQNWYKLRSTTILAPRQGHAAPLPRTCTPHQPGKTYAMHPCILRFVTPLRGRGVHTNSKDNSWQHQAFLATDVYSPPIFSDCVGLFYILLGQPGGPPPRPSRRYAKSDPNVLISKRRLSRDHSTYHINLTAFLPGAAWNWDVHDDSPPVLPSCSCARNHRSQFWLSLLRLGAAAASHPASGGALR